MPKPSKSNHLLGFGIKSIQILVTTPGFKPSSRNARYTGVSVNQYKMLTICEPI
jgi:hypothetical protein